MFFTYPKKNFCFYITFILSSANTFNLDQSKDLSFGKELMTIKLILFSFNTGFQNLIPFSANENKANSLSL